MKDVIGYLRYSSENQDDNTLEVQSSAIELFAKNGGGTLLRLFPDKAESGRDDNREEFLKMYNALKSGELKADTILIYKMSRFFRDVPLWTIYEDRLRQLGVEVISVTEPLPENPGLANLYKTMIRAFDQFTSDNIGAMSRDGTMQIVRKGYWSGGPAKFGYDNAQIPNREGDKSKGITVERGTLVRNPREMAIVIRAFEIAAATGKGGSLIYKQMVEETGGPVLGRDGQPLGGKGINRIISDPIYTGRFFYNKHSYRRVADERGANGGTRWQRIRNPQSEWVPGVNEDWRAISDELWDKVQEVRAKNRGEHLGFGAANKRASYLLTGIVVCGVCGNNCGGKWQKSKNSVYHYYRCRGAMDGATTCSNKSKIRGIELESAILQKLFSELLDEKFIRDVAAELIEMNSRAAAAVPDRGELERRREELTTEIATLLDLAGKVGTRIEMLAQKIADCERERKSIESKLKSSGRSAAMSLAELMPKVRRKLEDVCGLLRSNGNQDEMRLALREWIEAVRIDADGKVYIKWRASAVYELLGMAPADVRNGVGWNPPTPILTSLETLAAWHPLLAAASVAAAASAPMIIGFSGFSGAASPMASGFAGSGFVGFSGFSGTSAA